MDALSLFLTLGYFLTLIGLILGALLLKYLWNTTMPDLFNLKTITYWQAFRLQFIAAILLGYPLANI